MKAAQISEYGHVEVVKIVDVEKPQAEAGQLVVEVHASSINPFDTKIREGYMKDMIPLTLPVTLGGDIAGVVSELGEGVDHFAVGDKVYGAANVVAGNSGAFAEFAATKASQVGKMPTSIGFNEAAAITLTGLSALQAIEEHIQLKPGQKILIHGGSGGIGSISIQLAKNIGAYVATTASGDGVEFVKSLGADEVIDYKTQDFAELLSGYDAVFDTVGGETYEKSFKVLKKGGLIVSMAVFQPNAELMEEYGVTALSQSTHTTTEVLEKLTKLIDEGVITIHVDKTFKLDEIQQAFEALESGQVKGKIAVSIAE
jgi:alcohol dehydrogenase